MSGFTDVLKTLAPTVASAFLGPLGGSVVAAVGGILGISEPTQDKIKQAIESGQMTGEQIAQLKALEMQYQNEEKERASSIPNSSSRIGLTPETGKSRPRTTPTGCWPTPSSAASSRWSERRCSGMPRSNRRWPGRWSGTCRPKPSRSWRIISAAAPAVRQKRSCWRGRQRSSNPAQFLPSCPAKDGLSVSLPVGSHRGKTAVNQQFQQRGGES